MRIFNFYGLYRIGYGYIAYFLIRIKDLVGFLGTQGLDINANHTSGFYRFLPIYTDLNRFLGTQGPIINPFKSLIRIRK